MWRVSCRTVLPRETWPVLGVKVLFTDTGVEVCAFAGSDEIVHSHANCVNIVPFVLSAFASLSMSSDYTPPYSRASNSSASFEGKSTFFPIPCHCASVDLLTNLVFSLFTFVVPCLLIKSSLRFVSILVFTCVHLMVFPQIRVVNADKPVGWSVKNVRSACPP